MVSPLKVVTHISNYGKNRNKSVNLRHNRNIDHRKIDKYLMAQTPNRFQAVAKKQFDAQGALEQF
jgi:hypothetical protein